MKELKTCKRMCALALLASALVGPSEVEAASYDPGTTVVVFVHGFDPDGYRAPGVFGDDAIHDDVLQLAAVLDQPTWQTDPAAPNQVAATIYYGDTPPAWYTPEDVAADQATPAGVPLYALRVARYIVHVVERAPEATAVNVVSASLGTLVSRYMIEHDLLAVASSELITRWTQVVGVTIGNWAATNGDPQLIDLFFGASPDVDHMHYDWIDANISGHTTMNTALFGPMIIGHWIATDDGSELTLLSGEPNDGTNLCEDEFFHDATTASALHPATDGTLQMPARSYGHTSHTGVRDNTGAWAGIGSMAQNNVRVTISVSRCKAFSTGDSFFQGRGEWVFQSIVHSARATLLYGATTPINEFIKEGGNPPLVKFGRSETRYPNVVLFDQIIAPGETELNLTFFVDELDWLPKFYEVFENPFGSNKNLATFQRVVSTTVDSLLRVENNRMSCDLTTRVRQVY